MDFPRLLFVTPHAFNHRTGGGIAFSNLLRGWPADRLATVHNDDEPVSDDVCRNYFKLGPPELDLAEPFASMRRFMRSTPAASTPPAEAARTPPPPLAGIKRLGRGLLGDGLPERSQLTPRLARWIADFRPEVLYTILGTNGMMALIEAIRDRFRLPLVVHIMDDWPAALHRHGLLARRERAIMEDRLARLFGDAAECIAISPAMAVAYAKRYGRPFRHFQNTVDVAHWRSSAKTDLTVKPPAEVLYIGSIFPTAQLESLVDCAQAVAALNQAGYPMRLSIATQPHQAARYHQRLAIHPTIRIEDTIADDDAFYARLAAADALLVPVNFDAESIRFIRYSMPAKLPAYMVSGTPILVYGPRDTAQVQYADADKWGHVVATRDRAALSTGIRTVLEDDVLRRRVREAATAAAIRNHDAATVRPAFQSVLAGASRIRPMERTA